MVKWSSGEHNEILIFLQVTEKLAQVLFEDYQKIWWKIIGRLSKRSYVSWWIDQRKKEKVEETTEI